jgi:amidase
VSHENRPEQDATATTRVRSDLGVTTEPWRMSAVQLAEAIRSRYVSSREVIDAHMRRIEEVNPRIRAITVALVETALEAAGDADAAVARGDDVPPLHGVPFTVKENIDLIEAPTTQGLRALSMAYPARDAPVVERVRSAGAIPIAHTNCPTIAVRWHTDSEQWGPTFNPWDRNRTPGASSGGEAAALATGMTPLGLGNDGLGSLRWPAQCCGVAALKPTLGRIPHASSIEPADPAIGVQLTAVEGPMARTVADLRAALEIMSGPTWRDPWTAPIPLRGRDLNTPIRVAVVVDPGGGGVARQVRGAVDRAAAALSDTGYELIEAEPPSIDDAAKLLLDMLNTPDIRAMWHGTSSMLPTDTRRFLSAFYEAAGDPEPAETMHSFAVRTSLARAWAEFQESHPLVLAPISTEVPFEPGTDLEDGRVSQTIHDMRMAMAVNALGLPAVAVPVGVADGLPQVVQLVGARYREDVCLDAAQAIEDRRGILTPIDPIW